MDVKGTMAALEAAGTEQNRKVYARHGVKPPAFGVSYAELGRLQKSIGVDQELARALWKTGNHDARVLATMVADPAQVTAAELDQWISGVGNYVIADAFAKLVAFSPHAGAKSEAWRKAKSEMQSAVGWTVFGAMLAAQRELPSPGELERTLETIERTIHSAPNRTRYAMNNALIGIGCVSDALSAKAIAAAKRIGAVEVDHGETGCKTPDAATYIPKARAYYASKAAQRARSAGRGPKSPPKAAALAAKTRGKSKA